VADVPTITSATRIGIMWTAGLAKGGAPVLDYQLWYDQANGNYVILASSVTLLPFTATGLVTGNIYKFKVLARNIFGYSVFSVKVAILAVQAPAQPTAPTTAISGSIILITWTAPSTMGSPITSYAILIRQANESSFS
jgi:hypothetical protein